MRISSKSFQHGGTVPVKHTCDGTDTSPELAWTEPPDGTQTFALIVDDPDAPGGTFVHWVVFNIGGNRGGLEEGRLPGECVQGVNDFGNTTYSGPCPPKGKPHSYHFKLYALDNRPFLKRGASKSDLEKAMKGHTVGDAEIIGYYGR